jgi:2',3'-cyclic-nucleotide 2'-phosphodiesterase (5'-nucleotidase family)
MLISVACAGLAGPERFNKDKELPIPALRRLATAAVAVALAALAALALAGAAFAESMQVTFLLVIGIYQMGDQKMADGKRRGGFARLAAIVQAERARGGHLILAHGGDTISLSPTRNRGAKP